MAKMKTHEEFVEEVRLIHGDKFEFLSEYSGIMNDIRLNCKDCGYTFSSKAKNINRKRNKYGCFNCFKIGFTKQNNVFLEEIYNIYGDSLTVLETYKNVYTSLKCKCNKCGFVIERTPSNLLRKNKGEHFCPKCTSKVHYSNSYLKEFYKDNIYNVHGDRFQVLSQYTDSKTKLKVHCRDHGIFYNTYQQIINHYGCQECALEAVMGNTNKAKSHEHFLSKLDNVTKEDYEFITKYIGSKKDITIKHKKCGYVWETTPNNFMYAGTRCPNCKQSKAETSIFNCVKEYGLVSELGLRFDDCRNKIPLPFDNAIKKDDKIQLIVESDGIQHFEKVDYFGEESFKYTKENDKIKNQYCIDNNIPLIRIPYWEFDNIEHVLDNVLKYFNLIDGKCENPSIVEKYYVRDGWDQDEYIAQAPCNKDEVLN